MTAQWTRVVLSRRQRENFDAHELAVLSGGFIGSTKCSTSTSRGKVEYRYIYQLCSHCFQAREAHTCVGERCLFMSTTYTGDYFALDPDYPDTFP